MLRNPFHRHNNRHPSVHCLSSQEQEQSHTSPLSNFCFAGDFRTVKVHFWPPFITKYSISVSETGEEPDLEITRNITAVLGEAAYLGCRYLGDEAVEKAEWKRKSNSKVKSTRLAGFQNGQPFSRDNFSEPDSITNLTVRMWVSSVDVEGEYICEFETEEQEFTDNAFVTVVGKPSQQYTS